MGKNVVIAVLGLLLLATSATSYFLWRSSGLRAPEPTGEVRRELAELKSAGAWRQLAETIRAAGDAVVRTGPSGAISEQDAVERFYGLLAILSNTTRLPFNVDPARPLIVTRDLQPALTKIGGNSPDADYYGFPLSPDYSYRLRGTRSKAPFFDIQVQSATFDPEDSKPELRLASSLSSDDLVYDEAGRFEILISKERPAGYEGAWLPMDGQTFTGVVREYHHDAGAEGDPHLEIEVVSEIPPPASLSDEEVAGRIQRVLFMSRFWFHARSWFPELLEPKALNSFPDVESDPGSVVSRALNVGLEHRVGSWKLAPDEALIVEARFPGDPPYWAFQITDRWQETADFRRRRVHVNDATATIDEDGLVRIVVSAADPGRPNWVDTGGRTEGFMSLRWVPRGEDLSVATRVVKLAELRPESKAAH